jgi:hypothetical protein
VDVALNLRFYKLLEISPVAEELLAFKEAPLRHGVIHSVQRTINRVTSQGSTRSVCAATLCRRTTCRSHGTAWLGIPDTSLNRAGEEVGLGMYEVVILVKNYSW